MQDPIMLPLEEAAVCKPQKKKTAARKASVFQQGQNVKGFQELAPPLPTQTGKKVLKRKLKEGSPLFQQPENSPSASLSPSDSLPDSSTSGSEYRALRRKYLLLEEESFKVGKELREVEDVVKTLEKEKLAFLDELVVLEGLVDPSELQSQGQRLR